MKLSKKTCCTLFTFLTLLNIALRYPKKWREMGSDTYFIHGLANSVSVNGYAKWVINPLSVFGLYPYSYPSAAPYLFSGVSQCTGLSMDWTIFVVAMIIGIFGMFGTYLLAKEVKNDDVFAFLVVFAFSTAPIFLISTRWRISTRFLFVVLLIFLLWSLLRYYHKKDKRYVLLSVVLILALAFIHRMVWLSIPLLLAYFGAAVIQRLSGKIRLSKKTLISALAVLLLGALIIWTVIFTGSTLFLILLIFVAYLLSILFQKLDKKLKIPTVISLILALLFVYGFFAQFSGIEFYKDLFWIYSSDYFFEGEGVHILPLNMFVNYAAWVGVLLIFVFVGFMIVLFKPKKNFDDWFILLSLIFLVPLSAFGTYTIMFFLPVFSLLIGIGLYKIVNVNLLKKYVFPMIVACLLISLSFSCCMIDYWEDEGIHRGDPSKTFITKDETYSAAMFLREYGHGSFVSYNDRLAYRISVYSEVPLFPGDGAWPLTHGFIEDVEITGLTKFTLNLDYIYATNKTAQKDFNALLTLNCDDNIAKEILSKYCIYYYVENNNMQPQDQFFRSVREKRYKIYDDGVESIWYLGRGY